MHGLLNDIRHGLRTIIHAPGFALVVTLTIGLGIAVNTAVFSLIDSTLLRPLPFEQAERLMIVWKVSEQFGASIGAQASEVAFWRKNLPSFEHLEGSSPASFELSGDQEPVRLPGAFISSGLLDCLRIRPILGRPITESDARGQFGKVALISEALWRSRFGGNDDAIGRTLRLDGEEHTIIGVLPGWCRYPRDDTEVWVPVDIESPAAAERLIGMDVLGRLRDGATMAQAQGELDGLGEAPGLTSFGMGDWKPTVQPVSVGYQGVSTAWLVLLAAVGFVLLSACANVAGMMLARGLMRQREMAVRLSLGASRFRLLRKTMIESLLLATLGGAAGLVLAVWMADVFTQLTPRGFFIPVKEVRLDARLLLCVAGLVGLTTLLCGAAPALQALRVPLLRSLKEGGAGSGSGGGGASRGSLRARNGLLIVQIAACFVLVIGAGLLVRSFVRMVEAPTGFRPEGLLAVNLQLPERRYPTEELKAQFIAQYAALIAARPEVQALTVADGVPLNHWMLMGTPDIEGREQTQAARQTSVSCARVDADYFSVLGIRLIEGRPFTADEVASGEKLAIINASMARRLWPGESPLGARIILDATYTIIAVADDVRQENPLTGGGSESGGGSDQLYFPLQTSTLSSLTGPWFVARTKVDPKALIGTMSAMLWSLDSEQPISTASPMTELYARTVARPRFTLLLVGTLAGVAMFLMAIGVFGVTAYSVARQTREIGIRAALGARAELLVRGVVRQGLRIAAIGLVIGGLLSLGLSRLMGHLLYDVAALDPPTYAAGVLALLGVTWLACYLPARRAAKVDPMVALRQE